MTAPVAKKAATVATTKYQPKHAAPSKLPASAKSLPAKPYAKTNAVGNAGIKAAGKTASAAKGTVTFGASKTRSSFVNSFDNSMAPKQRPKKSVVTFRHTIAAEFWVGLILLLIEDTDGDNSSTNNRWVQLSAYTLTFGILFGITTGGREAARFSSALGGLILLTLMVKKGNPLDYLTVFKNTSSAPANESGSTTEAPSTGTAGISRTPITG